MYGLADLRALVLSPAQFLKIHRHARTALPQISRDGAEINNLHNTRKGEKAFLWVPFVKLLREGVDFDIIFWYSSERAAITRCF